MIGFVMMALGGYRFAMASGGFEEFRRTSQWRWPTQERLGAGPAAQYLGPGEDKIRLSGVIFPHFRGGIRQVEQMRLQAGRGQPLNMTDGLGEYYGQFVITSIEEGKTAFLGDMTPRKIDFNIELLKYQ